MLSGQFYTFSTGTLFGKEKLAFNYTQTIQCTPKKLYPIVIAPPVHYLKQLYTSPIYDKNEEQLELFTGTISELKESTICPNGFERNGSFCQECENCRPNTCEIGYRRNYRSGLCEDIDECIENANICQYMCENQLGSYRCFCPIGFKINNSSQCQDVNECRQFQIDCGQDRTCFNTQGAYECIDIPCPVGYIRQNESDCLLKCYQRSPTCSPRRAIYIYYRFFALPRLTASNQILYQLPMTHQNKSSIKIIDKNNFNISFPFILDGFNLKTNRTLIESNEYEFEIHLYNNEFNGKYVSHYRHHRRRRLHTIFVIQINVSPFHF
ncbi:unnamed protein product [Adineta steineri]|uniref:EGF-like domain-containing protein n=1 Tax=Adineta steineri TaxID=433720 RepID=A0A815ILQ4_9BILA|nr:unnamed protein product [Adineta steineri]CAF3654914.1 unnamed protein product [Adineta steineri]